MLTPKLQLSVPEQGTQYLSSQQCSSMLQGNWDACFVCQLVKLQNATEELGMGPNMILWHYFFQYVPSTNFLCLMTLTVTSICILVLSFC